MTAPRTIAPIAIVRPEPTPEDEKLMGRLTPQDQVQAFEESTGVKLTEKQLSRFLVAQAYKGGDLAAMHDEGEIVMAPQGARVLLRAILQEDASILSLAGELAGHAIEYDARTCITHEIIEVGPGVRKALDDAGVPDDSREERSLIRQFTSWLVGRGCERGARPMRGDHCFVLSTVADRASKTSRSVRLWTVHVDDLSLRWPAPMR